MAQRPQDGSCRQRGLHEDMMLYCSVTMTFILGRPRLEVTSYHETDLHAALELKVRGLRMTQVNEELPPIYNRRL